MAAYRRVDDLRSRVVWADCLYIGINSGPNARYRVWENLYLFSLWASGHGTSESLLLPVKPDEFSTLSLQEYFRRVNAERPLVDLLPVLI